MNNDILPSKGRHSASQSNGQPAWYLDGSSPVHNTPRPSSQDQDKDEAASPIDPDFADLQTAAEPTLGGQLQSRVQDLLAQPMDRKKFLKTAGIAGVGVLGLGQVLRLLQDQGNHAGGHNVASGPAYGGGNYGGKSRG